MKSIENIFAAFLLVVGITSPASAQKYVPDWNKIRDMELSYTDSAVDNKPVTKHILVDKDISKADSVRLVHYLAGFGWIPEAGDFVKNRRVYMDSALMIAPYYVDIWFQKAYPLLIAGKYELGMPCLDSAVKYDQEGYVLAYRGYIKCIFQKHYHEAIADLTKATAQTGEGHIEDHTNSFYLGLCYLQLNRFDSCEYLFSHAIDQQRKDYGYKVVHYLNWFYLGIAKYEQDDFAGAIACMDSSLARYPQFSDAKFYKSWCLSEEHEYKQAFDLMKEANSDFIAGYTLNEDNARIEPYPYQVNKYHLEESMDIMEQKLKKQHTKAR